MIFLVAPSNHGLGSVRSAVVVARRLWASVAVASRSSGTRSGLAAEILSIDKDYLELNTSRLLLKCEEDIKFAAAGDGSVSRRLFSIARIVSRFGRPETQAVEGSLRRDTWHNVPPNH